MSDYEIRRCEFGFVVTGPVPVSEVSALVEYGEALGFDQLDGLVADELGVTLAVTNEELSTAWREALCISSEPGPESKVDAWLRGEPVECPWDSPTKDGDA